MLLHIQMPGATFVASPRRWLKEYGRRIKPGARPLLILQPMGPVMFVFDVSDTEPLPGAPPLPHEVIQPFETTGTKVGDRLRMLDQNSRRDGIKITYTKQGSQSAGQITIRKEPYTEYFVLKGKNKKIIEVPIRYDIVINEALSDETKYASTVHELAHLYCGHLGTPNIRWWPSRTGLKESVEEFEAEATSYLVCKRIGIYSPSEKYLIHYVENNETIPSISLNIILKSAGLIERMSNQKLPLRKSN